MIGLNNVLAIISEHLNKFRKKMELNITDYFIICMYSTFINKDKDKYQKSGHTHVVVRDDDDDTNRGNISSD